MSVSFHSRSKQIGRYAWAIVATTGFLFIIYHVIYPDSVQAGRAKLQDWYQSQHNVAPGNAVIHTEPWVQPEIPAYQPPAQSAEGGEGGEGEASIYHDDSDDGDLSNPDPNKYRVLRSLTSRDGKFWPLNWNDEAYNANVIPHPTEHDQWIMVAQHEQYRDENLDHSEELACAARFENGQLHCIGAPAALPIAKSIIGLCEGADVVANFRLGPRDARMFYGPESPFILYGSQSQYACLSIWAQDFRALFGAASFASDAGGGGRAAAALFANHTEIQRPRYDASMQKNFFLFWDRDNTTYAHYDIYPARSFAQIDANGSVVPTLVGDDLAHPAREQDQSCMDRYMPQLADPVYEGIHQATNSLSITLCKRGACVPDESNTFILHLFQHKLYYDWHGVYEPYPVLFRPSRPFELYAIGQKALWIHGRNRLTEQTDAIQYLLQPELSLAENQTEMFYVTSISWKTHGQKYHGYIDDPLILAFGIEDTRSGAIDVLAEELVKDLAMC